MEHFRNPGHFLFCLHGRRVLLSYIYMSKILHLARLSTVALRQALVSVNKQLKHNKEFQGHGWGFCLVEVGARAFFDSAV